MLFLTNRLCRVRQLHHITRYRDTFCVLQSRVALANSRRLLSSSPRQPRVLSSVNTYAGRPHWKPGQEPGIDPEAADDPKHKYIPRADCEITVVDFSEDKITKQHLDNASLVDWIEQQKSDASWPKCRWINVNGLSWDVVQALGKYKNLHRLAIEDLIDMESRTKADWYSDHVYISLTLQKLVQPMHPSDVSEHPGSKRGFLRSLWRGRDPVPASDAAELSKDGYVLTKQKKSDQHSYTSKLRTIQGYRGGSNLERIAFMEARSALTRMNLAVCAEEVSIFLLSDNTVISFFESSAQDIEVPILSRLNTPDTIIRSLCDASMLTQAIIDAIIDLAAPVATAYQDVIGNLEMEVLTDPNLQHAKDLYVVTSEITTIRNFIAPIASLVASLYGLRPETTNKPMVHDPRSASQIKISATTKTFLGDMEDHCFLIIQTFDQLHHSAQGMIDLIFNTITAYQNISMKQLTAATIMFLPLTFITGYFGMNLTEFPNLEHNELWFWSIAAPIASGTALVLARGKIKRFVLGARHRRKIHSQRSQHIK